MGTHRWHSVSQPASHSHYGHWLPLLKYYEKLLKSVVCVCRSFFLSFYTLICHLLLLFSLYHSPSDGVGVSGTFETIFSSSSLPFLPIPTYVFFSSLFPFFFANHSWTLSFINSIQLFLVSWVSGMRRGEQSRELGYGMRARVARIFSSHL